MSLIFTFVISILNLMASIIRWITVERKIKLQNLIKSSIKKKSSDKKKKLPHSQPKHR